jgi:hypothetical protein
MLTIRGAHIWDTQHGIQQRDLHMSDVIHAQGTRDAEVIDLDGCTIFPALINAHDHLELNHYPRTKFRDKYDNAHQWGEDVSARLDDEPFKTLRAYPLEDRCFIGGLKNLLCGALTVAHHNPPHKCLFKRDFPVRVLRRYGWAHSLHFTPEAEIVRSYRATPPDVPWFIHLAEGTDEIAAGEYQRLKALGCVGANTVIVHGVGMTDEDIADAASTVRGLVICPTTNLYLLGMQRHVGLWRYHGGNITLGNDSRLTADGDFLREPRKARLVGGCDASCVGEAVFNRAAFVLGIPNIGHLQPNAYADWMARDENSFLSTRSNLALVVRGGVPQIGDPDVIAKFTQAQTIPATLDGRPKRIERRLAAQIARCTLRERGLELDPDFVQAEQKKERRMLFKRG